MIDRMKLFIDKRRSYAVDTTAAVSWEAGQPAALTSNADGEPVVTLATGASGEIPIGVFWGNKVSQITKVEVETISFVDGVGNATNGPIQLRGTSVVVGSERVTSVNGVTLYDGGGTDYSLTAGGALTRVGTIPSGGTVVIKYRRNVLVREANEMVGTNYDRGFDDTSGNDLATVLQGNTQFSTDMYDTAQSYSIDAPLYIDSDGRFTSVDTGSVQFGRVRTPPTATKPLLEIEFSTPLAG